MIAITTTTFDIYGAAEFEPLPGTNDGETRRRVNRVATLDGGVTAPDGGYSDGDRTLVYEWKPISATHNSAVDRIVKLYSRVHVSTPSGVYLAAPEVFTQGSGLNSITLLVIEKLSA